MLGAHLHVAELGHFENGVVAPTRSDKYKACPFGARRAIKATSTSGDNNAISAQVPTIRSNIFFIYLTTTVKETNIHQLTVWSHMFSNILKRQEFSRPSFA